MAKYTVSEFLKRLTSRFWKKGYEWGLRTIRVFLAVTFVAVVIATLAECQPFTHYWQVKPTPQPRCRQGFAQLITMGVADIITDVLLIAFPIPIIIHSGMPLKRKISLVALFSMSIVLIVITGARVPMVIDRRGIQQFRSMFASSEILAATIVSNAIVLGSFLRDRGLKKAKFKAPSTTDSMERRGSTRTHTLPQCSSDEDLARSLGYRTKPELAEKRTSVPRPAPMADLGLLAPTQQPGPFTNTNWQFPGKEDGSQTAGNASVKAADIRDLCRVHVQTVVGECRSSMSAACSKMVRMLPRQPTPLSHTTSLRNLAGDQGRPTLCSRMVAPIHRQHVDRHDYRNNQRTTTCLHSATNYAILVACCQRIAS
jgi:hypothetical protein